MSRVGPYFVLAFLVALFFAGAPSYADDPGAEPSLADFAYSMTLTTRVDAPLHSAFLPFEVYAGLASGDLADLRVFNASGEVVPHALRYRESRNEVTDEQRVPFFPLETDARDSSTLTADFEIERDPNGAILRVRAKSERRTPEKPKDALPTAYLLDLGTFLFSELRIELEAAPGDYVFPITVEASEDLGSFRALASKQALASLDYGGHRVVKDRIVLPATRTHYVRLSWGTRTLPAKLKSVTAVAPSRLEDSERYDDRQVRGLPGNKPRVYLFDLGARLPVERLSLVLPEANTFAEAELRGLESLDRAERKSEPRVLFRRTERFYRIVRDGQTFESRPLTFDRRPRRYFELETSEKGGGLGRGVPELKVSYRPHELLFLARGSGPFELGFGHHAARPSRFSAEALLGFVPEEERQALAPGDTVLEKRVERRGVAALTPPPAPPPVRKYVLWAVLIVGVLVLGGVAIRVAKRGERSAPTH